ncbi:amino acid/amide ABC transporter membrane protein 1 (HAAT family) [Aliiruegeria haliotis]|uniref:Amino acid/amide ABC transporter membrane protein 1 (HAAT family) n=1 Tax=Aliiruegeria haliotis TaxID=1280846 RepID=A0A2T0RWL5_9RHOB|nr:urea ABC transporter permease subunit UrtB [Aliiruegeria haliotis]PRY25443.1 amino acid/amide ABC transporter membrane protein 1 (HAAT family) [Aliiruegeria haliotis]
MTRTIFAALAAWMLCVCTAMAQDSPIQQLLQEHRTLIEKSSRKSIEPAIDALRDSGLPEAQAVLEQWQAKALWQRKADKLFFFGEKIDSKTYRLLDIATGEIEGEFPKKELKQLKPNSGIRSMIGAALVQFQLMADDPAKRVEALDAIQRDPAPEHLTALKGAIETEVDPEIRARKERLVRLLTITYGRDDAERISAIESFSGDLGVDARGALNPLVATTRTAAAAIPDDANVAKRLKPGSEDFSEAEAYALLVSSNLAPAHISASEKRMALQDNIEGGSVGGVPVAQLDTDEARERAYVALAEAGTVPATATEAEVAAALASHIFFDRYAEPSEAITDAAAKALGSINTQVGLNQTADLALDALSLASIYFLAAIGLAITFGVMGVINMAHGEFIMMGAYTGYVVQQVIPDYTVSILVALPLAFAVTFAAGVAMERLVIRWLYNRPLETLLATFGISIALQQLAKNIFGTQARPLTSPAWLDGALVLNDVVSISYIRIAIFVLALIFLGVFLFIMKRTRLGLEVRAVTQNPRMAASMGINPDRINMLTFGLGSGIAGIAGVAIGLYAKVTSELGSDYIVQSFMTVVVGGVGNIWGTLLGATMIGFLQKGIEWMNPSNTLAAQTYMIIFIIIFIQFRPRGIIALKGRAAGD